MPVMRILTPLGGGPLSKTWTDPLNGTVVDATLAALTLIPTAILYGLLPLTCDPTTSYQSDGLWVRTWRVAGVTVVTTGDGAEMTGKVLTS